MKEPSVALYHRGRQGYYTLRPWREQSRQLRHAFLIPDEGRPDTVIRSARDWARANGFKVRVWRLAPSDQIALVWDKAKPTDYAPF